MFVATFWIFLWLGHSMGFIGFGLLWSPPALFLLIVEDWTLFLVALSFLLYYICIFHSLLSDVHFEFIT